MKTPKRKQETCSRCGGELKVLDTKGSFCHLCGIFVNLGDGLRERHARWKRKNREARLRHKIRELIELTLWQREKRLKLEYYKESLWQCLDDIQMREYMDGTYGQDVEGS